MNISNILQKRARTIEQAEKEKTKLKDIKSKLEKRIKDLEASIPEETGKAGEEVINNLLAKESNLSPRKKQDELDVGDKFRDYASKIVKVLAVGYCKQKKKVIYFGQRKNGYVSAWGENSVREIIYN